MSATVTIIERNKNCGFYQNDMNNRCIATFEGILPLDFIEDATLAFMNADGTAVISKETLEAKILSDGREYVSYQREINKNRKTWEKYVFAYRVEKSFRDALTSDARYETWSNFAIDYFEEEDLLKEQLSFFQKVAQNLDFEHNYYYVMESV